MNNPGKTRLMIVTGSLSFAEIFLRDQIRELTATGFEVLLVCSRDSMSRASLEFGCRLRTIDMERSIDPIADLRCLIKLLRILREFRPSILHAHTPKAALLAMMAARVVGVPVRMQTIHGLRSECLTGRQRWVVETMERLTAACSTHSFAVSASLKREAELRGICSSEKLRVLGRGSIAGVSLDHFNPANHLLEAEALKAKFQIAADSLVISYIGRIARDKGLLILANSWKLLRSEHPSLRLFIAGPVDDTDPVDPAILEEFRRDLRVTLIEEFVSNVATVLTASDLFVQPSFREGLGVAALEASAMQVPVVAARVTGLIDAVLDGRTGLLVDPSDPLALAAALDALLKNPDRRKAMGCEGRRFVTEHFERGAVVRRNVQEYRRITAGREIKTALRDARSNGGLLWKRLMDVSVSLLLLVLLSPAILLVAFAVMVSMGWPVLFSQVRAGRHGTPFLLWKFRTMRQPAPGETMIGTDRIRVTRLGELLRRLSLDELPQLWNVLRGEMSLVGPRPLLLAYIERYNSLEARRHEVKPGITGLSQVNGRNALSWTEKFELDVQYVDRLSPVLDLQILFRTAKKVFWMQGIVPEGQGAMPEFQGSNAPGTAG